MRPLSFDQHRKYKAIIEEVIFYVAQYDDLTKDDSVGYYEAMTLLRFGLEYGFHSEGEFHRKKFWRAIKKACNHSISKLKGETDAVLDMIGLMRETGILSRKAMR